MHILLLNLGAESLEAASNALAGQGYDLAVERGLNVDQLLTLLPEVLVTEATTFCARNATYVTKTELKEAIENIQRFLEPVVAALLGGSSFTKRWEPGGPWR